MEKQEIKDLVQAAILNDETEIVIGDFVSKEVVEALESKLVFVFGESETKITWSKSFAETIKTYYGNKPNELE